MALTPEEQKELDALNAELGPALTPEEEAELADLNAELSPTSTQKDRPWYSITPEGMETIARGASINAPFSTVTQAIVSGGKALYKGATEGASIPEEYSQQMANYEDERKRVGDSLGTLGTIATSLPYAAAGVGTSLLDVGTRTALTQDAENIIPEVSKSGIIMAGLQSLPGVVGATAKGLAKLPGKLLRKSDDAMEAYIARAPELKSVSLEEDVGKIADFGSGVTAQADEAAQAVDITKNAVDQAKTKAQVLKEAHAASMLEGSNATAKQKSELLLQRIEAERALKEANESFSAAQTNAKAERASQISQRKEATRNVPTEAVEALENASEAQLAGLRAKAADQASRMDQSDVRFPTSGLKQIISDETAPRTIPQMNQETGELLRPTAADPRVLELQTMINNLPPEINATQLLSVRQALSKLGYKKEQGAAGAKDAYSEINTMFDSTPGIQEGYSELRAAMKGDIDFRGTAKSLGDRSEQALSRLGGKNTLKLEEGIAKLEQDTGVSIRPLMAGYLQQLKEINELRQSPLNVDDSVVKAAQKNLDEIRGTIVKLGAPKEKAMAPNFQEDVLKAQDQLAWVTDQLNQAKNQVKELGYDKQSAQSLIERNFPSRKTNLAAQDELQKVAGAMGDEGLVSRVRDIGYQQELGKGSLAGSRAVNVGRSLGKAVAGTVGEAVGGVAGALADVSAGQATTKPLDVYRLLAKTANTKWGKTLQEAYSRGVPNSVAATHFLLQQTDPEYNKAISEEE